MGRKRKCDEVAKDTRNAIIPFIISGQGMEITFDFFLLEYIARVSNDARVLALLSLTSFAVAQLLAPYRVACAQLYHLCIAPALTRTASAVFRGVLSACAYQRAFFSMLCKETRALKLASLDIVQPTTRAKHSRAWVRRGANYYQCACQMLAAMCKSGTLCLGTQYCSTTYATRFLHDPLRIEFGRPPIHKVKREPDDPHNPCVNIGTEIRRIFLAVVMSMGNMHQAPRMAAVLAVATEWKMWKYGFDLHEHNREKSATTRRKTPVSRIPYGKRIRRQNLVPEFWRMSFKVYIYWPGFAFNQISAVLSFSYRKFPDDPTAPIRVRLSAELPSSPEHRGDDDPYEEMEAYLDLGVKGADTGFILPFTRWMSSFLCKIYPV